MAASTATGAGYECKLAPTGVIPPVIVVNSHAGGVTVFDGVIKELYGKPITAEVAVDNGKRMTYSWKVKGLKGRETHVGSVVTPGLRYRLTRQKATNAASISVKVVGYNNTYRSSGKCRPIK